ncbi:Ig-like domain-containing protein [Vibrio litoralis]|uniref:Ig-like domain-containing protein n=2 Tax=Vibrio TaxID=662 RepID=UPI00040C6A7E|nr:Ig-like domain-containing protein [Vibrio litoralis]
MNNLKRYMSSLFLWFFLAVLAGCGNESSGLPSQLGESVGQLTIVPENPSVAAGETLQLELKQGGASIEPSEVSWFSSDTSVVQVDKNGVMKGIKEGSAEVTAVYQGQETTVTVTILPPKATGLQVLPQVTSVAGGVVVNFIAQGLYSDGSNEDVTQSAVWTSSNSSIATVTLGEVTTLSAGEVTIKAEWQGFSGSAILTVTNATLSSLNISPSSLNLANGTSDKLTATAIFSDGSSVDVSEQTTWISGDAGVASVDDSGLVTANSVGSTTVTADYGTLSKDVAITTTNATLETLTVSPATATLANGLTKQFNATATFSDNTTQDVTSSVSWSSSDTNVADIDVAGLATASTKGTTTITASLSSQTSTAALTVSNATLVSLTIEPDSITMAKGDRASINVIAKYSDGRSEDVTAQATLISDNSSVAGVNVDNTVQAAGVGSANITASLNAKQSDPIPVTVTAATVDSITIEPTVLSLLVDTSEQLKATANYSDGTTRDVTSDASWTTANSDFVSVNADGLVTANLVTTSDVDITASYLGKFETLGVEVIQDTVASVAITPPTLDLAKGDTGDLTATANFDITGNRDVTSSTTWTTDDPSIATVTSNGTVQSIGEGVVTITGTYVYEGNTVFDTAEVTVGPKRADLLHINALRTADLDLLGLIQLNVGAGDSLFTIQSEVTYSDGTSRILAPNEPQYMTDNAQLINIDATGEVTLADANVLETANVTASFESLVSDNQINVACLARVDLLGIITLGLACDIDDTQANPNYVAP